LRFFPVALRGLTQVLRAALMLLACGVFCALAASRAQAEPRIALIIGNSAYEAVSSLDNPTRDAAAISETLESLGFQVTLLSDSSLVQMRRAITDFGRALREAGPEATGLFYYAGHGVQSFGSNYLLPVDVALSDAADLDLVAVEAQSVLRQMFSARNKVNIVLLDACRNNPFSDIPEFNDNGLAEMKAPTGTYLAYATAPGAVAMDGLDGNSPFTAALVKQMTVPGQAIEQTLKNVRVAVLEETGGRQTPWDSSSLTTNFIFTPALAVAAPLAEPSGAEKRLYEMAQREGSQAAYSFYLEAYPSGTFSEIARVELAAIAKNATKDPDGEGVTPATTPAPPAPPPVIDAGDVTFTSPLTVGNTEVLGHSIAELIKGSPIYPPLEGLPDELWKGQQCSTCHNWTEEALCAQGKVYMAQNSVRSLAKEHPLGGGLKLNLRAWAAGGCRDK
jgi:hypothetical protein